MENFSPAKKKLQRKTNVIPTIHLYTKTQNQQSKTITNQHYAKGSRKKIVWYKEACKICQRKILPQRCSKFVRAPTDLRKYKIENQQKKFSKTKSSDNKKKNKQEKQSNQQDYRSSRIRLQCAGKDLSVLLAFSPQRQPMVELRLKSKMFHKQKDSFALKRSTLKVKRQYRLLFYSFTLPLAKMTKIIVPTTKMAAVNQNNVSHSSLVFWKQN